MGASKDPTSPSPSRMSRAHLIYSVLLVSSALASACTSTVPPPGSLTASTSLTVSKVEIVGNDELSDDTIAEGLALREPVGFFSVTKTYYDPMALEVDRRRIVQFYKTRGFFSANVTRVVPRREGDEVAIEIHVVEGERTTIARTAIAGAANLEGLERDELLGVTELELGDPMIYSNYERAQDLVSDYLATKGYAFAKVDGAIQVDRDDARAGVAILVDPGPRVHFGEIIIEGNGTIPEEAVRNRVVWEKGELYDPEKLNETRNLLYELGLFSVVRFDMDKEARPEVADVKILLAEGTKHKLKFGVGAGIDRARYELRALAGYTEQGFLHPLLTLRAELRPAYQILRQVKGTGGFGGEASLGLDKDDFIFPRDRLGNLLVYTDQDYQAYSIRGPRYQLAYSRPFLGDDLRVSLSWDYRYQCFPQVNEGILEADRPLLGIPEDPADLCSGFGFSDGSYQVGAFGQNIVYDLRDSPIETRDGFYTQLLLEESGPYALSDFEYLKATPEVRGYYSPWERLTLAARVRHGRTLGGEGVLPITQRFFSGGAASHRGFAFQRLSPMIETPEGDFVPVGGKAQVETSTELRFNITKLWDNWLGTVLFLDGGDVTTDVADIGFTDLHWAVGTGLRYYTLIGPIRFDVGYRLNRKGEGEPDAGQNFAFHFSLGEAF